MTHTNLKSHLYTYGMDTCKFSRDSDAPVVFLRGNPRPGDSEIYPCSFLRMRFDEWSILFVLICLGHMYMESNVWATLTHNRLR